MSFLGLLLTAFFPALASAQTPPPTTPAAISRTFVTLSINGRNVGDALVALIGTDVFLRTADLERAGITKFAGNRQTIAGAEYVSLKSLAPGFTYTFDSKALTLQVIVHEAGLLGSQVIDLRQGPPEGARFVADRGTFLNYALAKGIGPGLTGFFENGVDLRHALLYNTFQYGDGGVGRGLSQLIFDDRARVRRTIVGDAPIGTGQLGGSEILGGISASRQFTLNPYLVTFPTPTLRGQVLLPSQAEIYVNGVLVRTITLQPGQFTLQDIPTLLGSSQTQVVIRNALGTTTTGSQFFSVAGLLRPGLTDYAFGAGFERPTLSGPGGYRKFAAMGRYAVGINDRLTIGSRFEAGAGTVSGGMTATAALGKIAVLLAGAASESLGVGGAAAAVSLSAPTQRAFGLGAFLQWESPHYSTLSLGPFDSRDTLEIGGTASLLISRTTSFTASAQNLINTQNGPLNQLSLDLTQQLGNQMSLLINATRSRGQSIFGNASANSFSVSLIRPIGLHGTLELSHTIQSGAAGVSRSTGVQFSHSINGDYSLGYTANVSFGQGNNAGLAMQYQGRSGNVQGFLANSAQGITGLVSLSGGVALVGSHFFLTRPINDAFALVETPGLAGAQVYGNNKFEGTTNRAGFLLVPDLISEVPNDVHVQLPQHNVDATITGISSPIIPQYRGAAILRYAVQRVRAVLFSVSLRRKNGVTVTPEYGQVTVTAPSVNQVSEIDEQGRAYFGDLAAGSYNAHVDYLQESCDFRLDVPTRSVALLNLGTFICSER